jgi:hypothetical protein
VALDSVAGFVSVSAAVSETWFGDATFCPVPGSVAGFCVVPSSVGETAVTGTAGGRSFATAGADGFVKAFTPTYDREIASRAAMPIPIGLSFRASQNCRSSSTPADFRAVIGTFGSGMTFGVTTAGFSTGGGLTGAFAMVFSSSRVFATFGGTTGAGFSGSLTVFCLFLSIGAAGTSFGRASAGLSAISGAGGFETGIGAGDSIVRFDSTLISDTADTGSFCETGGTCVTGEDGSAASTGVGTGATGTTGSTGASFGRAATG